MTLSTLTETLPLTETITPTDQAGVAEAVRRAATNRTAVYPIGGGTSLEYGLTPQRPGIGLSLASLNRVIDYPARDMTITVEAGMTMNALAATLAEENQWLPIDAPQSEQATIGGVVATSWSGARRYGAGTVRDYVIGISAVDGSGLEFKGGGRVVKNVAGYDFCKLLTGSCGALGVITQVTLKITPRPQKSALLACDLADWQTAERLLTALVHTATTPCAIELLTGPAWLGVAAAGTVARLVVGLEGRAAEVDWMLTKLAGEWRELGVNSTEVISDNAAVELWSRLREFSANVDASPLVLKVALRPSALVTYIEQLKSIDSQVSVQAHAGNGIVIAQFAQFAASDIAHALIAKLQPAAIAADGHVVVLHSQGLGELTRQAVFGGAAAASPWMQKVKQQFDPHGLLNPGRFDYA